MVLRMVMAEAVFSVYAPPALYLPQPLALQCQIPAAWRATAYFPQKSQKNRECCETSIFLICLRRVDP